MTIKNELPTADDDNVRGMLAAADKRRGHPPGLVFTLSAGAGDASDTSEEQQPPAAGQDAPSREP